MATYPKISFTRYALAGAVILVPALLLERTNERYAWAYAVVVLVGLVVFHWRGVTMAATFTSKALSGKE